MFTAIDKFGNEVDIQDAAEDGEYYCKLCKQKVFQRHPIEKMWHFSHYKSTGKQQYYECIDKWKYEDTEWKRAWIRRFKPECREQPVEFNGEKHLADVKVDNKVILFISEDIKYKKFKERTEFFNNAGMTVLWIFKEYDEIQEETMFEKYPYVGELSWHKPRSPFKEIENLGKECFIMFQLSEEEYDDYALMYVKSAKDRFTSITLRETKHYCINDFVLVVNGTSPERRQVPEYKLDSIDSFIKEKCYEVIFYSFDKDEYLIIESNDGKNYFFNNHNVKAKPCTLIDRDGVISWKHYSVNMDIEKWCLVKLTKIPKPRFICPTIAIEQKPEPKPEPKPMSYEERIRIMREQQRQWDSYLVRRYVVYGPTSLDDLSNQIDDVAFLAYNGETKELFEIVNWKKPELKSAYPVNTHDKVVQGIRVSLNRVFQMKPDAWYLIDCKYLGE